ncbi:VanZ family protein [Pseudothermotoga sp.]|uniref:VanZ family protein n=1 Tax=Pseudothermotoga sp. TaxID=2033661 RepID=UPI0031F6D70B
MDRRWLMIVVLIALAFWISIVLYFGTRNANVSSQQARWAYRTLKKVDELLDFSKMPLFIQLKEKLNRLWFGNRKMPTVELVRKSAHVGLYMVLGIIAFWFALLYSRKLLMAILLGLSLPGFVAGLDEYLQQFRGRGASLNDIVIDISGTIVGVILCLLSLSVGRFVRFLARRRFRKVV